MDAGLTAAVDGVEPATVCWSVSTKLDPEPMSFGADFAHRRVAAHTGKYRTLTVTISHLP